MFRLADNLDEENNDVVAVLPSEEDIWEWYDRAGVETVLLPSPPISFKRTLPGQLVAVLAAFKTVFQLAILLRREDVDVLHVNEYTYLYALVSGVLGGARTVCHVRTILESGYRRVPVVLFVYLLSDRVICVSEATKRQMFGHPRFDDDKVLVVRDGLPDPETIRSGDGETFRRQFGIDPGSTLLVSVSKLVPSKGQAELAAAFGEVDWDRQVELAIVGGEFRGYEEYARRLERTCEDDPDVHLTGFYPDVADVYAAADAMVHVPQNEDPFPNVVLEAMIAGLPVLGTDSGGIPEQVDHGSTGYVVGKTKSEIAEGLRSIVTDEEEMRAMGERSRRKAFDAYSPEEFYRTIDEIYAALGDSRDRPVKRYSPADTD